MHKREKACNGHRKVHLPRDSGINLSTQTDVSVFCLSGVSIQGVAGGQPELICSFSCYPLLLFHTDSTTRGSPKYIRRDYRALGMRVKDMGAKVVVFSVLPVKGKSSSRNELIQQVNTCICGLCKREDLCFRTCVDE